MSFLAYFVGERVVNVKKEIIFLFGIQIKENQAFSLTIFHSLFLPFY